MKNVHDLIRRPIITESTSEEIVNNIYFFEVDKQANKAEIKYAIEQIFKVKVVRVNTMNVKPKPKRQGRFSGYTTGWKKAIVKLAPGTKTLPYFEGGER
ncbi:MAG: 50S ribosomal protein L23 [Paenibacillaceae bacterium]|jgi:large subunit ribosomal protein L23|nr:50S ribosomal protein L23 [Paenibacillaceae bacterium]